MSTYSLFILPPVHAAQLAGQAGQSELLVLRQVQDGADNVI